MSKKRKNPKHVNEGLGRAREVLWDSLGQQAVERAGRGPQLKGVVHEIAVRDSLNHSLDALREGHRAKLVAAANAPAVDVVTVRPSGGVHARYQVKDLTSEAGLRDLERRLAGGEYRSAKLIGTDETAKAWNARSPTKAMRASGVSSDTTRRAAHNAGARPRGGDLILGNARDIARFAGGAAVVGGVISAGVAAVEGIDDLRRGRIDAATCAKRVAVSGATGAAAAGGRTAAALTLKEGAKQLASRTGAETLRRAAGSTAGTAVVFALVEQGIDTVALARGQIDGREYGARACGTLATSGGAYGGALAGAALGSAVPVVGTALGAVVGSIVGALSVGALGRRIGRALF